jgi:hypothetical protein
MADSVLKSYLISLGFATNGGSEFKRSLKDYEKAVVDAEKAIEDARWAGAQTQEEIAKLTRETNLKLAREALAKAADAKKQEDELAKKRKEDAAALIKGFEKLAIAAAAAATAIVYAVSKIANVFDNLYFQAQRSGTSVQSLRAIGHAFAQTGGSAQQAQASVDSFTTKLRNNPGLQQFTKDIGVDQRLGGVDKYIATLDAIKARTKDSPFIGVQYAEMLGISEENYNQFLRQGDAIKAYKREYDGLLKTFGLDTEKAAANSVLFERAMGKLRATAGILADKLLTALAPAITGIVDRFQAWVEANPGALDKILTNISNAIIKVAEGIAKFIASITGDDGDGFIKKWDAFTARVVRFAETIERIVYGVEKLMKMLHLLSDTKTVLGSSDRTVAALNALTGGTAAPDGPGGFRSGGAQSGAEGEDKRNWLQRNLPKGLGGQDAPGEGTAGGRKIKATSKNIDPAVEAYIRKAAAARGINPDTAVGIADGEGLGGSTYDKLTPGDFKDGKATSFGPFQMHRGGAGSVGTEYEKKTGHKVDDPKYLEEQIDFSLDWAKKNGWNAWYGRSKHGIGTGEGLNWNPNAPPSDKQTPGNVAPTDGVGGVDQIQGSAAEKRKQAITDQLRNQIAQAAKAAEVNAEIYSGGQDEDGPNRTGSHRHDHGKSADLKLYTLGKDGKKQYLSMNDPAQRAKMEAFVRESVKAGANGVGSGPGYMGESGIHIGGGSPSAWGAGGSSSNAPDWVRRAHAEGMEARNSKRTTPNVPMAGSATVGFDPNSIKVATPAGIGPGSTSNSTDARSVKQNINNTVTVTGVERPDQHAKAVQSTLNNVHQMSLENAQSAIA